MAHLEATWGIDLSDVKEARTKLLPANYEAKDIIDLLRLAVPISSTFPIGDAYLLAERRGATDPDDVVEKAIIVFCELSNKEADKQKKKTETVH